MKLQKYMNDFDPQGCMGVHYLLFTIDKHVNKRPKQYDILRTISFFFYIFKWSPTDKSEIVAEIDSSNRKIYHIRIYSIISPQGSSFCPFQR